MRIDRYLSGSGPVSYVSTRRYEHRNGIVYHRDTRVPLGLSMSVPKGNKHIGELSLFMLMV